MQLEFLAEADKMKSIVRQTMLIDKSRRENDAEHSWHFALMALTLFEYAGIDGVDIDRVIKMALPALWKFVEFVISDSIEKGYVLPAVDPTGEIGGLT
jgi:trehalose/maltose hydrolase-like predicted phosphorylase